MPEAVATKSSEGKQAQAKPRGPAQDHPRETGFASSYANVMALQRNAGNRAVASLMEPNYARTTLPPVVADTIQAPGQPLDQDTRKYMEAHFERNFGDVRVHTNARASDSADSMGASAYTVGRNIVFGAGQYKPGSQIGKSLLAHELAHTVQQRHNLSTIYAPQDALESQAEAAGAFTAMGSKSSELSPAPAMVQRQPKPGASHLEAYGLIFFKVWPEHMKEEMPTVEDARRVLARISVIDAQGLSESQITPTTAGWSFSHPSIGEYATVTIFSQLVGGSTRYGLDVTANKVVRIRSGSSLGKGKAPGAISGGGGTAPAKADASASGDAQKTDTPNKTSSDATGTSQRPVLTAEQHQRWEQLRRLMPDGGSHTDEDPAEILRLYDVLLDAVQNPTFSKDQGDPWINFSKFLANNRTKIEGILRGGPNGPLTQEKIEKVIEEYDKYISTKPAEEPKELETPKDYDKFLKYNPNWQKLSAADRKLLLDFANMTPDELERAPIDFTKVTTDMKISMALKLAKSWPAAILDAAVNAFTDPKFVITLIVTIGIYIGLWLTPDPTWVTKIAAGALTAYMLTQFALSDIYGTAVAWSDLQDSCKQATTVGELEAAGNIFAAQIGAVGFDILLFIAMWGLGKLAGPKLSKIGAKRGVARAQAGVEAAEAKPGSGKVNKLGGADAAAQTDLLQKAARPTASATLDALADSLPDQAAKQGLDGLRNSIGDANALKALKSEAARGSDLSRFLSEKAQAPEVRAKAQSELLQAKAKLARAKLIEADTIKDAALRESVRTEQINTIKQILSDAGVLGDPKIQRAIKGGDVAKLVGDLGEAIQRTRMQAKYPASQGYTVLSNIEIVQEVPGFRSISQWQSAERAAGRPGDTGGLYESGNKLWKSLGEADSLAARQGPGGKLQPVEIQEVKTGDAKGESAKAARQLKKVNTGMQQIAAGQEGIRIFDRVAKNELGADITDTFDLSQLSGLKTSTLGPEGKTGFDESLGFDTATLTAVADSLIKNLPPARLPVIPPIVSPRDKEEKRKEEKEEDAVPAGH